MNDYFQFIKCLFAIFVNCEKLKEIRIKEINILFEVRLRFTYEYEIYLIEFIIVICCK